MYVPEALAATVYLNMHLADTMGDPTATQLGLMPLFDQTAAFYKDAGSCRSLPQHHRPAGEGDGIRSEISAPNLTAVERWAHGGAPAINQLFTGISGAGWSACQLSLAKAPRSVTLVSPDYGADTPVGIYLLGRAGAGYRAQTVAYVAIVSN